MTPQAVFVPWLHMHQPPIWIHRSDGAKLMGNLQKMLESEPNSEQHWNAQWFAKAYKNPASYVAQLFQEGYSPRIMVDYSGVLLEELAFLSQNGLFEHLEVGGDRIGNVIELFRYVLAQYPEAIEFAGSAYSHCYFPATPERDHEAQIIGWQRVFRNLFGKEALSRVRGFWLPEMGMMGNPKQALKLIRLLKRCGYEWIILPHSALEHPEGWSNPLVENQVHWLVVESEGESEKILCVVRDTEMGIRQQSGQNADGCLNDIRYRGQVFQEAGIEIPPLVVPTSDGENGNVMMFEYFPNTFSPLFRNAPSDVGFMTVSEYMDTFLPNGPTTEIKLNTSGGSWIGGHDSWFSGDERVKIGREIDRLSQSFASLQETNPGHVDLEAARRSLLLCETSCFVYWNDPFWFDQARQCLEWANSVIGVEERGIEAKAEATQDTAYQDSSVFEMPLKQPIRQRQSKLVRDRIPEIIQQSGNSCEVKTLSDAEYQQALRDKLIEEAREVAQANKEGLVKEIADVYEVIEALMAAYGMNPEEVIAKQAEIREERGGFEQKIKLLWTEIND